MNQESMGSRNQVEVGVNGKKKFRKVFWNRSNRTNRFL